MGSHLLISTTGLSGPLAEGISGRVAFRTVDRNGYGEMIEDGRNVNDEKSRSIRAKLDFEPTDSPTIRLGADYSDVDDHSGGYRFAGRGNSAIPPVVEQLGLATREDPQDAPGIRPLRQLDTGASMSRLTSMSAPTRRSSFLVGIDLSLPIKTLSFILIYEDNSPGLSA